MHRQLQAEHRARPESKERGIALETWPMPLPIRLDQGKRRAGDGKHKNEYRDQIDGVESRARITRASWPAARLTKNGDKPRHERKE